MGIDNKLFVNAYQHALDNANFTAVDAIKTSVDYYYDHLVSKNDQDLLNLAFCENITQKQLDDFLSTWDIEAEGGAKALLLAYVMKHHPDLTFNEYTGPRLKGVLNFHRFENLSLVSHYTKIVHELNKNNIIPMIMKGGAMKHLRPELPRHMGDIDILIFGDADFQKAKKIITDMGYEYEDNKHSIDLHTPGSKAGVLDIHRFIEIESKYNRGKLVREFKKRARLTNIFGTKTYLPCVEDILFISMVNLVKNIRNNTSIQGILFTLFDFEYLEHCTPDFDWNIIINNIRTTNAYPQMLIAIEFANRLVPGILPDFVAHDKKMNHYATQFFNRDIFYTKYVREIREKSGETKLRNVHSFKQFLEYLDIKLTKQFRFFILEHQPLINMWLKNANKRKDK